MRTRIGTIKKQMKRLCSGLLILAGCISLSSQVVLAADWPDDVSVSSPSAIVMDYSTGTILYEKNANEQLYPASITKIMTALLAIENCDMDEIVTFSEDAVYNTEGSSIARDVGEEMTMEQCLYGMMLESANECAYAIAEHVAGSEEAFVEMMNEKAAELGCTNTHFDNTNGLPDEEHYTSAYDMALIAQAAYSNETFRLIVGTSYYEIPATNKHDEITYLRNHHNMLYPYSSYDYLYDYCVGGKTGYTTEANSTLVTYAQKGDMILICVIMNASSPDHYTDTITLFDYCFENFQLWNISENESSYSDPLESFFDSTAQIFSNSLSLLSIDEDAQIVLPLNVDFSAAESTVIESSEGDSAGVIQYTYADRVVGTANLILSNESLEITLPSEESGDASGDAGKIVIHLGQILLGVLGALLVAALIVAILYFQKNFFILKHKMETKNRSLGKNQDTRRDRRERRRRRR